MASIQVYVDVELDEISTQDLIQELKNRKDEVEEHHIFLPVESIADKFKSEYIKAVFEKYTLYEIEKALPI